MLSIIVRCGTNMHDSFIFALGALEGLTCNSKKSVNRKDYDKFCHEFIFEKIKGKSFGESFCAKFSLNDTFLRNLSDETAKYHIERLGYIK